MKRIQLALFATALAGVLVIGGARAAGFIILVKAPLVSCPSSGIMDMSNVCNDIYKWTVLQ
jgi:hypothetical protein